MIRNLLTAQQVAAILNDPEAEKAKGRFSADSAAPAQVYFTLELPADVKEAIRTGLGVDLSAQKDVPMRWIRGDTAPHKDNGASAFKSTYIVYLSDEPAGEFVLDGVAHAIEQGSGITFQEGLLHETRGMGSTPRLLIGPMNELGFPVGGAVSFYYPSQADALNDTNQLAAYGDYLVQTVSGYSNWRLASTSTGPASQSIVYYAGQTLAGTFPDMYYLYPAAPCFLEGSTILCLVDGVEKYVPVESIRKGTLVKTAQDGYKAVEGIGRSTMKNPGDAARIEGRLYRCSREAYPELAEDLYVTGCHSILVDSITDEQREQTVAALGKIFITGKKYRLMACLDPHAEPWASEGDYTVWHFALESPDRFVNFGVYANGGLLVETTSIRFLHEKSNMELIE